MQISIIGSGNIGGGLGKFWAEKGIEVIIGVRNPGSSKARNANHPKITVTTIEKAIELSETIFMAVPFSAVREILSFSLDWKNKNIIDATNPVSEPLPAGFNSGAEAISHWTGSNKIVKAFNTTGAANLMDPHYGKISIDNYLCGNDQNVKAIVNILTETIGMTAVDVGGLENAALLESLAKLWINLAYKQGFGPDIAFKLLGR